MEIYKYTKLASESGKDGLIALAICAAFSAYFIYRMVNKSGGDLSQSKILVIVAIVAIVAFLAFAANNVMKRLNSKGSWVITIDDKVVQWNAPDGLEPSFVVNLDQIKTMQTTLSNDQNAKSYDLIMSDGQEISLGEDSGIDFDEFAAALQSRGVQLSEIEDQPSE